MTSNNLEERLLEENNESTDNTKTDSEAVKSQTPEKVASSTNNNTITELCDIPPIPESNTNSTECKTEPKVSKQITLKIKTTSDQRFVVLINLDATVSDLKKAVCKSSPDAIEPALQRLIYKGHVLKDEKKIDDDYHMKDSHTVILVKSRKKRTAPSNSVNAQSANQENVRAENRQNRENRAENVQNHTNANPFASMMAQAQGAQGTQGTQGMGGMPNIQNLMQNPNTMLDVMNNPMFQQITQNMMNNPQMMRQMLQNPMVQQMAANNPQMQAQLNMFSQNPGMMRAAFDMQRGMLQMRQAMQQMPNQQNVQQPQQQTQQQNVQQPQQQTQQQNAQQPQVNPFAALFGAQNTANNNASNASNVSGSAPVNDSSIDVSVGGNIPPNVSSESPANAVNDNNNNNVGSDDTENVSSVNASENVNSDNVSGSDSVSGNANNGNNPNIAANVNPFAAMFGAFPAQAQGGGQQQSQAANLQAMQNMMAMFGGGQQPQQVQGQQPQQQPAYNQQYFMPFGMPNVAQSQPANNVQPEILYREQLSTLNNMGFNNAQANIQALIATGGNVEAAVDRLLS